MLRCGVAFEVNVDGKTDDPRARCSRLGTEVSIQGSRLFRATYDPWLRQCRPVSFPVTVILTDYHLRDGETGTEVIAALRSTRNRILKAVLITGDTSAAVKEMPRDSDLRIASKPIKAEELLGMVNDLLATPVGPASNGASR